VTRHWLSSWHSKSERQRISENVRATVPGINIPTRRAAHRATSAITEFIVQMMAMIVAIMGSAAIKKIAKKFIVFFGSDVQGTLL
jgi:hypothetical protein